MFESPQVNFYVQDVEVSARLYRDSCGFTETFRTPEHGKRTTPTMPEQAGAGDRAAPWLQWGPARHLIQLHGPGWTRCWPSVTRLRITHVPRSRRSAGDCRCVQPPGPSVVLRPPRELEIRPNKKRLLSNRVRIPTVREHRENVSAHATEAVKVVRDHLTKRGREPVLYTLRAGRQVVVDGR